jgi:hypothetical protein
MAGGERNAFIILVGDLLRNTYMEDGAVAGGHDTKC